MQSFAGCLHHSAGPNAHGTIWLATDSVILKYQFTAATGINWRYLLQIFMISLPNIAGPGPSPAATYTPPENYMRARSGMVIVNNYGYFGGNSTRFQCTGGLFTNALARWTTISC